MRVILRNARFVLVERQAFPPMQTRNRFKHAAYLMAIDHWLIRWMSSIFIHQAGGRKSTSPTNKCPVCGCQSTAWPEFSHALMAQLMEKKPIAALSSWVHIHWKIRLLFLGSVPTGPSPDWKGRRLPFPYSRIILKLPLSISPASRTEAYGYGKISYWGFWWGVSSGNSLTRRRLS